MPSTSAPKALKWIALCLALACSLVRPQHYTATYTPNDTPVTSEKGQFGTNQCGTGTFQDSLCQNAFFNSLEDFCLWAPPYSNGKNATIGETERYEVAWCLKSGYGTRLIPQGTITGAHFVQTPDYVQITGNGDFSKMGIPRNDEGGELDPHGADGNGNPIGGLVFGNSFGDMMQYHEWTSFMSGSEFCFRACKPGPNAAQLCNHIYDVMGCQWNIPGDYSNSLFDSCTGDSAEPMGIYGNSTFRQGQPSTPGPHPKPSTSGCQTATIAYALGLPLESPTSSSDAQLATSSLYRSPSEAAATSTPNTAPPGWPIFWSDKVVVGMLLGFGSLIYGACLVF